jgi:hypothetical protein
MKCGRRFSLYPKVCAIPGVIYVITSAAQCLLALPSYQQELEWSRPTGPGSLQDVSTLFVVHRYHEPKYNVSFHYSEMLENILAQWRSREQRWDRSDNFVLLCHVQPHFDYFEVALQVGTNGYKVLTPG